eukprot:scaffold5267_cov135-Skeletonema_marinoi.AAC.13
MDAHLRQSNFSNYSDDLEQDRRLINQKLQLRRSKQHQNYPEEEEDDQSVLDYYNNNINSSSRNINTSSVQDGNYYYDNQDEKDIDINNGEITDEEYLLRQQHEQDEQMIGGKVHDTPEGLEAMNQALTTMPAAWWAKRKQWQKRRSFGSMGSVMGMSRGGFGRNSMMSSNRSGDGGGGVEEMMMMQEDMGMMMMDEHNGGGGEIEEKALGHPVLLTDPTTLGYDTDAFRQAGSNNGAYTTPGSSSNNKKKRGPTILYVPRAEIKRRGAQQMAFIISALSVVFLFMFGLEQLKLAQYAMVESPVPLHAYLAGEDRQDYDDAGNKVTLGSLGLQQFDGNIQGIPVVEFGKIQIDRDDPLAQQVQTETAAKGVDEGQQQSAGILHAADYFEILKGVITGWGITPAEIFDSEISPQYKALHWMAYEDILRRQPDTDFQIKKIIQRYALTVIYFATAGELWRDSALFLSNLDECSWNMKREPKYFLGAGACEEGFVTRLDLWGNHLTGALPPEIGLLNSLTSISVFDNNMRGPPPKSMVHLKKLQKLYLQKNEFQGDVDFLCGNEMDLFKTDCGKKGGVTCSCCTGCGYNANNDKPIG